MNMFFTLMIWPTIGKMDAGGFLYSGIVKLFEKVIG